MLRARPAAEPATVAKSSILFTIPSRYDGTVRNSSGGVVQFLYGEDGMDGVRVEEQVRSTDG